LDDRKRDEFAEVLLDDVIQSLAGPRYNGPKRQKQRYSDEWAAAA
jgi:hypothetical protein